MDLQKLIVEHSGIKLLSFLISVALWFYVTSTGQTQLTLTVPIELRNVPAGMTVVGDVTGSLDVRMQGQERVLRDGTIGKKVVALLDLSMTHEGENRVRVSPDDVKRPAGTTVTYLSQSEVKVKLERLVQKTYRLKPVLHGVPAAGYRLVGATVSPARISIEGPASVMRLLDSIETMPINIQKAKESVTVEPKIDYRGQPVKLMEKNIIVRVNIERIYK